MVQPSTAQHSSPLYTGQYRKLQVGWEAEGVKEIVKVHLTNEANMGKRPQIGSLGSSQQTLEPGMPLAVCYWAPPVTTWWGGFGDSDWLVGI